MLRGLTGRLVSQLVSAILNNPTLSLTSVFNNLIPTQLSLHLISTYTGGIYDPGHPSVAAIYVNPILAPENEPGTAVN